MAVDRTKIGEVAARLMDQLEESHGEDAQLESVMIIASITNDADKQSVVHYSVSDGMPQHVGLGLLAMVQNNLVR